MAKKFMIKKVLIVPLLVAMLIAPNITTAFAAETVDNLMASNTEIAVTQMVDTRTESVQAVDQQLSNIMLASNTSTTQAAKTGKELLIEKVDNIMGTRTVGDKKMGLLQMTYKVPGSGEVGAGSAARAVEDQNSTLLATLMNPELQELLSKDNNANRDKLKEATALVFTDVPATHWGAGYLAIPVYKGVISGYGDGRFGPEDSVTRGQVSVILAKTILKQEHIDQKIGSRAEKKCVETGGASWYATTWSAVAGNMLPIHLTGKNQSALYDSGCSRAEIAYAICSEFWADQIMPGGTYYEKAASASNSPYTDITKVVTCTADDNNEIVNFYINTLKNPNGGIPREWYASLLLLKDKGIMVGMGNGTVGWSSDVSRIQMVTLMDGLARVLGQELQANHK